MKTFWIPGIQNFLQIWSVSYNDDCHTFKHASSIYMNLWVYICMLYKSSMKYQYMCIHPIRHMSIYITYINIHVHVCMYVYTCMEHICTHIYNIYTHTHMGVYRAISPKKRISHKKKQSPPIKARASPQTRSSHLRSMYADGYICV